MNICAYTASLDLGPEWSEPVGDLGRMLGQKGHGLVFGGFATGLMEEVARGFAEAGAPVVGVVSASLLAVRDVFEGCTEVVRCNTLAERKQVMEERADAFLILPGGLGTLDEVTEVMARTQTGELAARPVFYDLNGYWDELFATLATMRAKGFLYRDVDQMATLAHTPEEVLAAMAELEEHPLPKVVLQHG